LCRVAFLNRSARHGRLPRRCLHSARSLFPPAALIARLSLPLRLHPCRVIITPTAERANSLREPNERARRTEGRCPFTGGAIGKPTAIITTGPLRRTIMWRFPGTISTRPRETGKSPDFRLTNVQARSNSSRRRAEHFRKAFRHVPARTRMLQGKLRWNL